MLVISDRRLLPSERVNAFSDDLFVLTEDSVTVYEACDGHMSESGRP